MLGPPLISYPLLPPPTHLYQNPFHSLTCCPPLLLLHPLSLLPFPSPSLHLPLVLEEEPLPLTLIPLLSSLVSQVTPDDASAVGSVRREVTRKVTVPRNSWMKGPQGGLRPSLMCNIMGGMTCWTKRIMGSTFAQDVGLTSIPPLQFAGAAVLWLRRERGSKTLLTRAPSTMRGMRQTTTSKSVEATLG